MKWINLRTVLKPNTMLAANYNIQLQIKDLLQQLNIPWQTEHVKGHQTEENLTWEAQFNNKADALATEAKLEITTTAASTQILYPTAKAHFIIEGNLIT
eukprot:7552896-Ditylum_brightwellii.AAC.1